MIVKTKAIEIRLTEKEWDTIRDCVNILDNIVSNLKKYYYNEELDTNQAYLYDDAVSADLSLTSLFEEFGYEHQFTAADDEE